MTQIDIDIPARPKPKPKPETYVGADGKKYGSQNAADNSYISAAKSAAAKNATAISAYKDLLAGMGVKPKNKHEAAGIAKFVLAQAAKTGANTAPRSNEFTKLFIQKFYGTYLRSSEGSKKVATARTALQEAFGDDWKEQVKGNKELAGLIKKYAGSVVTPNADELKALIQGSKTWKEATAAGGEYQYLKQFQAQTPGMGGETLATQTAAYNKYRRAFADTMTSYLAKSETDPAKLAAQIAIEEALFFGAGIGTDTFAARYKDYNDNADAFRELIGTGLSDDDRKNILYGTGAGAQEMRDKIINAKTFNDLYQQTKTAFYDVAKRDLTLNEKSGLLGGDTRTELALKRAGSVSQTLAEQAESYRLQTGQQMTQAQKDKLLYDEGAGDVYGALKSAFGLQSSYRKGSAGTFGFSRNQSGQLTQQI